MFHPLANIRLVNNFQAGNGLKPIGSNVSPKHETTDISQTSTLAKNEFIIYAKNVRGLTNEDRRAELEGELELVEKWNICILPETWRKQQTDCQWHQKAGI